MSTKVVLMFPYSGYETGSKRGELFWDMVKCCRKTTGGQCPIVVLNRDTETRNQAQAFLKDKRSGTDVEIFRVWSVDTCQMWLAGWGYVIDECKKGISRIVQLPGDIDAVSDKRDFFNKLEVFITLDGPWDIVIGDFSSTGGDVSAKELIDRYGTYALMANWFPEITQEILQ
jgi:hypothetical protein